MRYCLDSWAVLRWLEGEEPAASRVDEVLRSRPLMSWINVGEVYYIVLRKAGVDPASNILSALRSAVHLDDVSAERILAAAEIKARYPMAYADAIALATSEATNATLLTGAPEILDSGGSWATEDLR